MIEINVRERGFSLIETLIVLTIISIFILLTVPLSKKMIDLQKSKSFKTSLDSDILYIQNMSRGGEYSYSIRFFNNLYTISHSPYALKYRDYPTNWYLESMYDRITFDENGRVRDPGTLIFSTDDGYYKLIFSFGRGRHRIE